MIFQIQLAHRQTAVPLTRDYITGSDHGDAEAGFWGPDQGMKLDDTYLRPDIDETHQARLHDRFHCPAH